MFALKYKWEIFFIIVIAAVLPFVAYKHRQNRQFNAVAPIPKILTQKMAVPLIPAAFSQPESKIVSWESSDGTKQITMQIQDINMPNQTYSFFVSGPNIKISASDTPFFSKTVDAQTSFAIPFNAFSSDDKYLFIVEKNQNTTSYLIFNASGAPFANGNPYLDVGSLFDRYTSNYILHQVTGWASDTLLIIETQDKIGNPSTSFWFDITNLSFTPLATRF